MKRALFCTLCLVCALPAYSETTYAPAANVGYVLNTLAEKYQEKFGSRITLSSNVNSQQIANMEYLLGMIDKINNQAGITTQYAQTQQATQQAINTNAVDIAFNTLIKNPYKFNFTVDGVNSYTFRIHAAGAFKIDCGKGGNVNNLGIRTTELLITDATDQTNISCTWDNSGEHVISLSGTATGYSYAATNQAPYYPAISFNVDGNKGAITKISGGLGTVFPTLSNGNQPLFYQTFAGQTNLQTIPADLFTTLDENGNIIDGINGAPAQFMFYDTFSSATGLTGNIPATLFAGVQGEPKPKMFAGTFYGTTNLDGIEESDNEGLFTRINGEARSSMFDGLFNNSGIKTLPSKLFGHYTFSSNGKGVHAFYHAFRNTSNLTGNSATGQDANGNTIPLYEMDGIRTQTMTTNNSTGQNGHYPDALWIYHSATGVPQPNFDDECRMVATLACPESTASTPTDTNKNISIMWIGAEKTDKCINAVGTSATCEQIRNKYITD